MIPEKIVCLTEETVEVLYDLGEDHRIIGITGFAVRPEKARKEKHKVSAYTTANINKILDLNPDLVLAFSDMQGDIVKSLIENNIEVYTFNQRSIYEIFSMIYKLGLLVDSKHKAIQLIANLEEKIDNNQKYVKDFKKPRIYFEEWYDPMITGIKWVSELIELSNGIDIFNDLKECYSAKDRIITSDDVIQRNPDIIIASWCGKKVNFDSIRDREGWGNINAVKNNNIFEIKSPNILQPGIAPITDGYDQIINIIDSSSF